MISYRLPFPQKIGPDDPLRTLLIWYFYDSKPLIPLHVKITLRINVKTLQRLKRKYTLFIQWEAGMLKLHLEEISACPDGQFLHNVP